MFFRCCVSIKPNINKHFHIEKAFRLSCKVYSRRREDRSGSWLFLKSEEPAAIICGRRTWGRFRPAANLKMKKRGSRIKCSGFLEFCFPAPLPGIVRLVPSLAILLGFRECNSLRVSALGLPPGSGFSSSRPSGIRCGFPPSTSEYVIHKGFLFSRKAELAMQVLFHHAPDLISIREKLFSECSLKPCTAAALRITAAEFQSTPDHTWNKVVFFQMLAQVVRIL